MPGAGRAMPLAFRSHLSPPCMCSSCQLLNAAANELHNDKLLVLELAREEGLLSEYAAEVQVGQRPVSEV